MFELLAPFIGVGRHVTEAATAHPAQVNAPSGTPREDAPQGFLGGMMQSVGDFSRGLRQEGLSALLDPAGAVDRQRAQRELAGMFNVMRPEDMVCRPGQPDGPSAENTVTPEQFQQIARQYSDIRMGRTDIQLNTDGLSEGDATAYRRDTMHDLASIMQTNGGRQLIQGLSHNDKHHTTTISPLFRTNADGDYDASLGRDNTNGYAAPDGDGDLAYRNADGTSGAGVNSRVRINPGQGPIAPADADLTQDRWLPWRSDVLLYHELVHSLDQTRGTMDPNQAGDDGDGVAYDTGVDRSEHRAAGLGIYKNEAISENAYRSARRDIAAHSGNVGVRAGDATMPYRDTYFYHAQPAPAPDAAASPGTRRRDPHGAHDHHGDHDHHGPPDRPPGE